MRTIKYWRPNLLLAPTDLTTQAWPVPYTFGFVTWGTMPAHQFGEGLDDLFDAPPGIAIVVNDTDLIGMTDLEDNDMTVAADFAPYTVMCLRLLYRTAAGRTILDALVPGGNVTIESSSAQNACRGQQNLHAVATEMVTGAGSQNGVQLTAVRNALQRKPTTGDPFTFLATEINAMQKLDLAAAHDQAFEHPLNVTAQEMQAWVTNGTAIARLNGLQARQTQLKLALIAALDSFSPAGAPCASGVAFCTRRNTQINMTRPPAIGLGHELIHAYYFTRGEQPGRDFNHWSTALFEYKCVGIGPWRNSNLCENALRAQWGAIVATYGTDIDPLNAAQVHPRLQY